MTRDDESEWGNEPEDLVIAKLIADAAAMEADHPAWSDPRFLAWLARRESTVESNADFAARGREAMARAYCRRHGILRIKQEPTTISLDFAPDAGARQARLIEWIDLIGGDLNRATTFVGLPPSIDGAPFVACRIPDGTRDLEPIAHSGDVILVCLGRTAGSLGTRVIREGSRLSLASADTDDAAVATLTAVWCVH